MTFLIILALAWIGLWHYFYKFVSVVAYDMPKEKFILESLAEVCMDAGAIWIFLLVGLALIGALV